MVERNRLLIDPRVPAPVCSPQPVPDAEKPWGSFILFRSRAALRTQAFARSVKTSGVTSL